MNTAKIIFEDLARRSDDGKPAGVDIPRLVQRLLLFDSVILKSRRLVEVPDMIKTFGKHGFLKLLNSGVFKISCEFTSIIGDPVHNGVREVPLSHFTFGLMDAAERESQLRSLLIPLQGVPGLKNGERSSIEELLINGLVRPAPDYGAQLLAQFETDLRNNSPALAAAIKDQLRIQLGVEDAAFQAIVEESSERIFHVRNDFASRFGISDLKTHQILSQSVIALGRLNHRLADMIAYSAISGFSESEAPLLFGKLASIMAAQNPLTIEQQFDRVIKIANLPSVLPSSKVDVEALLKVRESPESRNFRSWLSGLESSSDAEIQEMVAGFRNRAASVLQSGPAKTARFLTSTAVGLIPGFGPVAGIAAGAIDTFLVDRLLPLSGPFTFLTKTYPSLFVE